MFAPGEAGCFRQVAALYSDHYRQVPLEVPVNEVPLYIITDVNIHLLSSQNIFGRCNNVVNSSCEAEFVQDPIGSQTVLRVSCHSSFKCPYRTYLQAFCHLIKVSLFAIAHSPLSTTQSSFMSHTQNNTES